MLKVLKVSAELAAAWSSQFEPGDQAAALALVKSIKVVSADEFASELRSLVLERAKSGRLPIGLYAERELPREHERLVPLFTQSPTTPVRARGPGPVPVAPLKPTEPEVGSEGIVANLITNLCRSDPDAFLNHPGPDVLRSKKVRRFMLVADFVGSGKRACDYLTAAWRVRSLRSWSSYDLLRFEVVAYSSTPLGRKRVEAHKCAPILSTALACPLLSQLRPLKKQEILSELCRKYKPRHRNLGAFGFGDTGALIAFHHGMPNNAPLLLWKETQTWRPLFPSRVTSGIARDGHSDAEGIREKLIELDERRLATSDWFASAPPDARANLLVLSALRRSPRDDECVSRRTGLTIPEIRRILRICSRARWIDSRRLPTDRGQAELAAARSRAPAPALVSEPEAFYYPKELRAPRKGV